MVQSQPQVTCAGRAPGSRSARMALAWVLLLAGCGSSTPATNEEAPYAVSVESFSEGDGAGFGQDKLPEIVLGPPHGKGTSLGSLDVVSLGSGGEIVLGFGSQTITDGAGADFVVFENAFWPNGDASAVYAELGEVSVSDDGKDWETFSCDTQGDGKGHFPGCAGWSPTLEYDTKLVPLDPEQTGGDAFDLADVGLRSARFVKIRDLKTLEPAGTSSGFDLDAIGVVHRD
ncbi:MAG TPA: hypothetical protein VHB79_18755 [Polyangiaceae bacterium]|nr:hypothetical protein [Polyangiaceae bacterium]